MEFHSWAAESVETSEQTRTDQLMSLWAAATKINLLRPD